MRATLGVVGYRLVALLTGNQYQLALSKSMAAQPDHKPYDRGKPLRTRHFAAAETAAPSPGSPRPVNATRYVVSRNRRGRSLPVMLRTKATTCRRIIGESVAAVMLGERVVGSVLPKPVAGPFFPKQ